ncbi:ATP-dependent zinc metalloprotease FtsH 1 [Planctomycetia bacterium]|nr:ATP-dependent zinc metalloprotease FtsH 1 [Planctomycetia bacterium]
MTLVLLVAAVLVSIFTWTSLPKNHGNTVPYSFFYSQLQKDQVRNVTFHGEMLIGRWKQIPTETPEGVTGTLVEQFNTALPSVQVPELEPELRKRGVQFNSVPVTDVGLGNLVFWVLLPLLFVFLMWNMMRRSADPFGAGGMMGGFIRSPARRFEKNDKSAKFDDVAGLKSAKQDLQEVVDFLRDPGRFTRLGAKIPKGVLLVGPPGTGKTLLARATAGEAGVPFFSINGSEFIQMFVGVGATRVRDLFKTAREAAPCIVFIDEIDAVGRVRGAGVGGGHDEREQTLNQILSEMDGFQQGETVIVLAATNRHDVLDPALLRPGRFDRHVTVDLPAREGRLGILRVHTRRVPLHDDVDLEVLSRTTMGFSGAELEKLVNESALKAARENKKRVEMTDFRYAIDIVTMGAPRDEKVEQSEKELTAWHEAGHAVLAWAQEGIDPVHKVSIVPRGRSLGVTLVMPESEIHNLGERRLKARIVMMMGGRAAEKMIFNEYSAGAQNDIEQSTSLARRMVARWGMSEIIGPVSFRQSEEHPFLGKEMHTYREFSEETTRQIDSEVQRIIKEAEHRAIELLTQYRDRMDRLVRALLESEDLVREQIEQILGPRPFPTNPTSSANTENPATAD